MFLVFVLTLSTGTLVSGEKSEPCPDTAQLTCGKTTYNPLSQSCCQEVVNSLANMTHPDCCGQKAYDRSTHLCCRHSAQVGLTDISSMGRPKCCGIKAFDVTLQKCCSADATDSMPIVYLPQSQSCKHAAKVGNLTKFTTYDMSKPECGCGVTYDPNRQRCCPGNVVVDIPANTTHPHCCGKTVYDQHTHKCCNGKTYGISGTVQPSCCGPLGVFYDQASELCCDGEKKYFNGLASPTCCGKEAFDAETHSCVKGKVDAKKGQEKKENAKKKAPCFKQDFKIRYRTIKPKGRIRGLRSPKACQDRCVERSKCFFWSYSPTRDRCRLHKAGSDRGALRRADWISGPKACPWPTPCFKHDTWISHGLLSGGLKGGIRSPKACQASCVKRSKCYFWSVSRIGKGCRLYKAGTGRKALRKAGWISGPKVCPWPTTK